MAFQYMTGGPTTTARTCWRRSKRTASARGPERIPALVREFLNDLYRHELRNLRDRQLRGEFARSALAGRVIELRRRYPLLSLPVDRWTDHRG